MSRPTLARIRTLALQQLTDEWRTPTTIGQQLGLNGGAHWYRLCLTLERLANDGHCDIRVSGNRRTFRRPAP